MSVRVPVPLAVLVAVAPAIAQDGSTVLVRVAAPAPAPVIARLESSSSAWIAERRSASGGLLFAAVPPGAYVLSAAGARRTLLVEPLEAVTVALVGAADGPLSLVVVHRAPRGARTVFDRDDLRLVPSGRDVISLLETAEPVTVTDRIDGGGLFPAEPARLSANGGSWTETTYLVDGVDITDPLRGGRPLVLPSTEVLETATLVSVAAPENAHGTAAVVALDVRRPSRAWGGALHAGATPGATAGGTPPPRERLGAWHELAGRASGPAANDRLGLLGAIEWRESSRFEAGAPGRLRSRLLGAFARAHWRANDRDEVRATANGQWVRRPGDPVPWRAGGEADERRSFFDARWQRRGDGAFIWTATLGRAGARTRGLAPSGAVERLRDGAIVEAIAERPASRDHTTAGFALRTPLVRTGGTHEAGFGLFLSRSAADLEPFTSTVGERVDGSPARAWSFASGRARLRASGVAVVASDRFSTGRMCAEAGLRADLVRGRAAGAPVGITWWDVSPRLSLRWSALARDGLVLSGTAGRRPHRLLLSWLEWGDPSAPRADVRRWIDTDGDGEPGPDERGALVGRAGPGGPIGTLDGDLSRPYTDEVMLAIEGHLAHGFGVRFAGVDRRQRRLLDSVNVGLTRDSYTTRLLPDPAGDLLGPGDDQLLPVAERRVGGEADRFLLTNPHGLDARYRGLELSLAWRVSDRLHVLLAGTAHRIDGPAAFRGFRAFENDAGLIGERFDSPNGDTHAEGRLFFDRAYTIKLSGYLRAPGDVHLGWVARYQDGQPFARLVVVPDLPQGPDFARAVPNGRHRFAHALTVDARVEKGVQRGRWRAGLSIAAFNLLQARHAVEENVVSGPAFRTPTLVQPPRTLRVGLHVDF